jgi:hypothetical protein
MKNVKLSLIKISTVAAVLALAAGCASTADLERVEKLAMEAKASADAANKCCQESKAKVDGMFKKSMKK